MQLCPSSTLFGCQSIPVFSSEARFPQPSTSCIPRPFLPLLSLSQFRIQQSQRVQDKSCSSSATTSTFTFLLCSLTFFSAPTSPHILWVEEEDNNEEEGDYGLKKMMIMKKKVMKKKRNVGGFVGTSSFTVRKERKRKGDKSVEAQPVCESRKGFLLSFNHT
ncbi:hypothetical protein LOK49_LG07G03275 [Camellia lanceoleosa]|uniref:Uncharacterized protein n=1 Tax=Camellia lanceoleosa TaxID=1840588 RepID=A0ACC0H226_9ERIC|nr:hypothetical protein LOK49_LG07G03275 [Camellia lanceoleosa]